MISLVNAPPPHSVDEVSTFRIFIMGNVFPRESRVETGTTPFYGCRFTVRFPSIDIAAFVGRNDFVFSVTIHVRHANAIVHLVRSG